MIKYAIGAVAGGVIGYFVIYRLIGCSSGSCPITASPYISTIYGIILGLLIAGAIKSPAKDKMTVTNEQQTSLINETAQVSAIKITAKEAKARIDSGDDIIILDVRTAAEYESGHVPNAILIPNETIKDNRPDLLPNLDVEILIYCRSGNRSAQAAKKLIDMGFRNVYDFGGIIDWPYDTVQGNSNE